MLVAFQAHTAAIVSVGVVLAQLRQMPDQRRGAVQPGAGVLQQLGQVQQVGQVALAAVRQQARGDAVQVDPASQHGQHALTPPGLVAGAALLHARLPGRVVAPQRVQLGPAQAQRRRGQGCAQQAFVLRRRAGGQPALQFGRHGAAVDRTLVRQVDAAHPAGTQRVTHGAGLAAGAHQHRHVARLHRAQTAIGSHEAGLLLPAGVQQAHHLAGAQLGQMLAVALGAQCFLGFDAPEGQGGCVLAASLPALAAPLRRHRVERQQVVAAGRLVAERALTLAFGLAEHAVDGLHHGGRGAEVGAQRGVPALGVAPRGQVGVDVRAAEGVDGLLGVTDQHQRGGRVVALHAVDGVEDAHLQRVGVLEFIDQCHRELLADARGQARAVGPAQRGVQPHEQVLIAHHRMACLFLRHASRAPHRRVAQQLGAGGRQVLQAAQKTDHVVQRRVLGALTLKPDLCQALRREAGPGRAVGLEGQEGQVRQRGLALRPFPQRFEPRVVVTGLQAPAVHGLGFDRGVQQPLELVSPRPPWRLQRLQLPLGLVSRIAEGPGGLRGHAVFGKGLGPGEQLLQRQAKIFGRGPPAGHHGGLGVVQRVQEVAPPVAHHLVLQRTLVGLQRLQEQAVAVEGVFAQHALAPAVDGGHGGLVHPLGGQAQRARLGGPLRTRERCSQVVQHIVAWRALGHLARHALKGRSGLGQATADAVAQFLGRRIGEGHHQDLGRRQRPAEGVRPSMAEHQAQHQRGDGEGLARAGAGLHQAAAAQRKAQGLQQGGCAGAVPHRGGTHGVPSAAIPGALALRLAAAGSACRIGPSKVRAQCANSPPAHKASKSGKARAAQASSSRSA